MVKHGYRCVHGSHVASNLDALGAMDDRMQFAKAPNCGLFDIRDVLAPVDYHYFLSRIALLRFKKVSKKEEGLDNHPPLCEMPDSMLGRLHELLLDTTNFLDLFPQSMTGQVVRACITCFSEDHPSMQRHVDDGKAVLTVVFSLCTEGCAFGTLELSSRRDGRINDESRDVVLYHSYDNTVYTFFGSHVTHSVQPLTRGRRYAMLLFFHTKYTIAQMAAL
jgi:hypothetical protein